MKYLIFCLVIIPYYLSAQTDFEILIPWHSDTSATALTFQEAENGDIFLLTNITNFYDGSDILVEGPLTHGSGIIKISETGLKIWRKLYLTNCLCEPLGDLNLHGRTPTNTFLLRNNDIFLPYSLYHGILPCNGNIGSFSFKKAGFIIDKESGNILQENLLLNDTNCSKDKIELVISSENEVMTLIYAEDISHQLYIETINEDFEVETITNIDSVFVNFQGSLSNTFFDEFTDNSFIIPNRKHFKIYNLEGMEINEFTFETPIEVGKRKMATNENYIALLVEGHYPVYPDRSSVITIFDRFGNLVSQQLFDNEVLIDLDFTNSNELIVLSDNSMNDFFDTISQPIDVRIFDVNLNLLKEKNYGQPFIHGKEIKVLANNDFGVLATRLKSIDIVNGKEADQIYFLRKPLDDLEIVATSLIEKEISLKIQPNPTTDYLNIHHQFSNKTIFQNGHFQITNLQGQVVDKFSVHHQDATMIIPVWGYPKGVYFLQFELEGEILETYKFIVQ